MTPRTLSLDGHVVACFEQSPDAPDGATPSVVLVHGIGVSSRYFGPLEQHLSRDAHVVAPDLPGFGRSHMPDRPP